MEAPPTDFDDAAVAVAAAAAWADSVTADAPAWAMDADHHEEAATAGDAHAIPDATQHGRAAGGGATEGDAASYLEDPAPVADDAAGLAWPPLALSQEADVAGGDGADGLVSYHAGEWPVDARGGDLDPHGPAAAAEPEAARMAHHDDGTGAQGVPSEGALEPAASSPAAPAAPAEADAADSDSAATDSDGRTPSGASQRRRTRSAWTHKKQRRTPVPAGAESAEEEEEEEDDAEEDEEDPNILYCICRKPYDKNKFMVQCDKCEDWYGSFSGAADRAAPHETLTERRPGWRWGWLATRFHTRCVGITSYEAKRADFYVCPPCKAELKGTTSCTGGDARTGGSCIEAHLDARAACHVARVTMTSGPRKVSSKDGHDTAGTVPATRGLIVGSAELTPAATQFDALSIRLLCLRPRQHGAPRRGAAGRPPTAAPTGRRPWQTPMPAGRRAWRTTSGRCCKRSS